jgi:hypothetical protein
MAIKNIKKGSVRSPWTPWKISTEGSASLTGDSRDHGSHNKKLSRSRALEVNGYLLDNLPRTLWLDFDPPFGAGSYFARLAKHTVGVEDARDRCVYIVITSDLAPPPPIYHKPVSIPMSKEWAIRFLKEFSASELFVGVDYIKFELADLKNRLYAIYSYTDGSVAWSPSKWIPVSYTAAGDWVHFSSSEDLHISDFDGPARYTTAGLGATKLSKNYFTMSPKSGEILPPTLEVSTGITYGTGGASTSIPKTGWLKMTSPQPLSYSGSAPP